MASILLLVYFFFCQQLTRVCLSVISLYIFHFETGRRSLSLMKVGTWMRFTPLGLCYYSWVEISLLLPSQFRVSPHKPPFFVPLTPLANKFLGPFKYIILVFKKISNTERKRNFPSATKLRQMFFLFFFWWGIWPALLLSSSYPPLPAVMQIVGWVQQWFFSENSVGYPTVGCAGLGVQWVEGTYFNIFFCSKAVVVLLISLFERVLQ